MDKYKWTLTKTLRNAPISIQGGAAIENCIKPKNYTDTLESNRSFTIPKGLSNRATKLMNIFSAFPEIELKKKNLLVNGKYIMKIGAFLKNVYSSKRSPGKKADIILKILADKGALVKCQFDKSNFIVWKKINRLKKYK